MDDQSFSVRLEAQLYFGQDNCAKRRQNTARGASRGPRAQKNPGPKERKNSRNKPVEKSKEYERIMQAHAAIPGAPAGNWRDLRTVFEFAGICGQGKETPS